MKNARITAICLAASIALIALGYAMGAQLIDSVESHMERASVAAMATMEG
jgi:hypothetical protein